MRGFARGRGTGLGEAIEKAVFLSSCAVLVFLYGFVSRMQGWFPNDVIERAWRQAAAPSAPPDFTVPLVYERTGTRVVDPRGMQPGLTLLASMWEHDERWMPGLRLIDPDGRVVHEWRTDPASVFADSVKRRGLRLREFDIQGSVLLPGGDVLANIEYLGTVRIDACSRVLWTLAEGGHHSIAPDVDGSFWIPGVSHRMPARSPEHPEGYAGLAGPIYQDRILRVSGDGAVLDEINLLDILYANGLQRYIVRARQDEAADITHLNDIEPLDASIAHGFPLFEPGDLVVSLRNLDLVFVFDPDSGRVKWHASDPFIRQHDPDFMAGGWIGVFDNNGDRSDRGRMLGGSRIVALQPHTDSARVLFPGPDSEYLHTRIRGKWQHLPNGNLLLTESAAGRVVEVTADGRTVWEWVAEPYGKDRVPLVSSATRLDLTADDVSRWPCSRLGRIERSAPSTIVTAKKEIEP